MNAYNESAGIPILTANMLTKSYGSAPVLNCVNLTLPAGRIIGLLGPNGSGKTTLIKLAAGLLTPTSGEILVCGRAPDEVTRGLVSYLPERTYLSPSMRVSETLDYFADFYADFDRARAVDMMSRLGIDDSVRLRTLSKGTKEKLQLILVMSRNARLYLLDEPIGGVDPAAREYILSTIISNYASDSTVLISTHLISDIEAVLDEFLFLRNGGIVMQSTVDDARERYGMSVDALFREVYRC